MLRVRSSSKKSVCANALACELGHVLARTEARTVPLRLSMATRRLPSVAFVTPASITYARASFQEPQLRERASAQSWKTATSACCQAYLGQAQAQGRQGVLQPDLGKEAWSLSKTQAQWIRTTSQPLAHGFCCKPKKFCGNLASLGRKGGHQWLQCTCRSKANALSFGALATFQQVAVWRHWDAVHHFYIKSCFQEPWFVWFGPLKRDLNLKQATLRQSLPSKK